MFKPERRARSYNLGERIVITLDDFYDAATACFIMIHDLAKMLPPITGEPIRYRP
jgi:hypothetical protein